MNRSFWKNFSTDFNTEKSVYAGVDDPALAVNLPDEVDTVIVGGGLLGLSTALELAQAGQSVALIEAKKIGDGPSGRSGGQLWPGFGSSLGEMIATFGDTRAIGVWNLTHDALATIHRRAATHKDNCEFYPGVLLTSKTDAQADWIKAESQILLRSGFQFATLLSSAEICKNHVNTKRYRNGILYEGHVGQQYGHLNPLIYTQTVAQLAQRCGAKLVENCTVEGVQSLGSAGYHVTTPHGKVKAKNIVFATGVDFMRPKGISFDIVPRAHIPVQTVILATEVISETQAREMVPGNACFCDASTVSMNYGRLITLPGRKGYFRLTLGGADALAQSMVALEVIKIEKEMRFMFPQLDRDDIKIDAIWGGNCDLSRNELPFLINPLEGMYYASGFSGQGMVNTTLYGSVIAEKIIGQDTGRFEILRQINPASYADNALLAWIQAAIALGFSS